MLEVATWLLRRCFGNGVVRSRALCGLVFWTEWAFNPIVFTSVIIHNNNRVENERNTFGISTQQKIEQKIKIYT